MSNDLNLQADFILNTTNLESNFTLGNQPEIQADLSINVTPSDYINEIIGNELIEATKDGKKVTITSKTFVFEQGIASDVWTIEHNLNKNPSFYAVDSAGRVQIPDEIIYDNENKITAKFVSAFAGFGYLN